MKKNKTYSIGEMSEICRISKKTLRYYDELGLIPSQRNDHNNYRYYTHDSLLIIPVLKYYKQMGFKLNEILDITAKDTPDTYSRLKECFLNKMNEITREQEELRQKNISIHDWHTLIVEAQMVTENKINEISIKYVPEAIFLSQSQISGNTAKDDIINISWTNYIEEINNAITGPVIIKYHSLDNRIKKIENQKITILQQSVFPPAEKDKYIFGNALMLSCYYIGEHDGLPAEYERICAWAKKHKYKLAEEVYERYITDYWTNCPSSKFVTEILIKISR